MPRRRHLLLAFGQPGFRRLFGARVASQFADGVFQASLAGAVLFNPEQQARAADIAAAFAVLLLPYSLLGPFAGVLLDRWSRQRVLVVCGVLRALGVLGIAAELAAGIDGPGFYASALAIISLSRFVLSALSAGLPRVVPEAELVTANAVSGTAGTLSGAVGGGVAVLVHLVVGAHSGDRGYALLSAAAAVPYLIGSTVALGFGRSDLGPTAAERAARETARQVLAGLAAGTRYVAGLAPVRNGLLAIGAHRLCYGVSTVTALLLYRNYFHAAGPLRVGLAGLAQLVVLVAAGGAIAALVTPLAFRHFGPVRWPVMLLVGAAAAQVALGVPFTPACTLAAGLLLGFAAQSIKISVDTLVQVHVADAYRGRVFALYDALFNVTLVIAAVITATALPADGHSIGAVLAVGAGYAVIALAYVTSSRRTTHAAR